MKTNTGISFSKVCFALTAFLLSICGIGTKAVALTIDSSYSYISGDWKESWGPNAISGSFGSTTSDGQPLITHILSDPHQWNSASGNIRPFDLSLSGSSAPFWSSSEGPKEGTHLHVNALNSTHFHTDSTKLAITLTASAYWNYLASEQDMHLTLQDVTTSAILLDLGDLSDHSSQVNGLYSVDVDPSHEYALTISASIYAFDAKEANLRASVQIPDSGMTSLLLAGSISALLWTKKRLMSGPAGSIPTKREP